MSGKNMEVTSLIPFVFRPQQATVQSDFFNVLLSYKISSPAIFFDRY